MAHPFAAGLALLLLVGAPEGDGGRDDCRPVPHVQLLHEVGGDAGAPLFCLQGLVPLPGGALLVTDRLDYRVKMIGADGTLVRNVGGRGTDPGKFLAPGPIDNTSAGVVVAEFAGSTVHTFSTRLDPKARFRTDGTVSDMRCDTRGGIWTVLLPENGPAVLAKYSQNGQKVLIRAPRHATGDHFSDACLLDIGGRGSLVMVFMVRNIIEVWDTSGNWLRDLVVPDLPAETPYRTVDAGTARGIWAVPDGVLFRSVCVDPRGRIFLLGGDHSVHPGRDVYLFDAAGKYAGLMTLPRETVMIRHGTEGQLWGIGRGRSSVAGYRVIWEENHAR